MKVADNGKTGITSGALRATILTAFRNITFLGNHAALIGVSVPLATLTETLRKHNITTVLVGRGFTSQMALAAIGNTQSIPSHVEQNSIAGTLYLHAEKGRDVIPSPDTFLHGESTLDALERFAKALGLRQEEEAAYQKQLSSFAERRVLALAESLDQNSSPAERAATYSRLISAGIASFNQNLAECLIRSDFLDVAVEFLEKLIENDSNNKGHITTLAEIYKDHCPELAKPLYERLRTLSAGQKGKKTDPYRLEIRRLRQELEQQEKARKSKLERKWRLAKSGKLEEMREIMHLPLGAALIEARLERPETDIDLVTIYKLADSGKECDERLRSLTIEKLLQRVRVRNLSDPEVIGFLEKIADRDLFLLALDTNQKRELLAGNGKNTRLLRRFFDRNFQQHVNRGVGLAEERRFEEAILEFELALEAFENNFEVLGDLSLCYGRWGYSALIRMAATDDADEQKRLREEAEALFVKSLKYKPDNVETLGWYLLVDALKKDYSSLEARSRRIIGIIDTNLLANDPSFGAANLAKLKNSALSNLGVALFERYKQEQKPNLLQEAENTLKTVSGRSIDIFNSRITITLVYLAAKKTDEAIESANNCLRLSEYGITRQFAKLLLDLSGYHGTNYGRLTDRQRQQIENICGSIREKISRG